jgi:hypothetical protein
MDISIQNVSRPAAVPAVQPLQFLAPQQIGEPDSGVAATLAGTQEGETVAAPLANMGEYLEQYYSPQAQAQRKAAIAGANLQTTNANQENTAAEATPNLPLAQRNLALTQTTAQTGLVQPQASLALAKIGQEQQEIPTATQAAIAEQTEAAQSAANKVNATPNVPTPGQPLSEPQMLANNQAQQNRLTEAHQEGQAALASMPFLQANQDGTNKIPEGMFINGKSLDRDKPVATPQQAIQDNNGNTVVVQGYRWEHGGLLTPQALQSLGYDPHLNDAISQSSSMESGRNATIQNTQNMAAARAGVLQQGTGSAAVQALNASNQYDYTTDPSDTLSKNVEKGAETVAKDLSKLPNIQTALKITPSVNDAIQNFETSKTSASGVPAKEAIIQAGRAFSGGIPTNAEIDNLQSAQGLPAKAGNILRSLLNGDTTATTTKDDYIAALNQVNQIYAKQAMQDVQNMTPSMDARAQKFAPTIFARAYPNIKNLFIPGTETPVQAAPTQTPNPQAQTTQPTSIPGGAIQMLQAHPELSSQFDQKYGQGASAQYLK